MYMLDFHIKIKIAWMTRKDHNKIFSLFFRFGWNLRMTKLTSTSLLFCTLFWLAVIVVLAGVEMMMMMMMMMMMTMISSWDHCQRSLPSRISDTLWVGFEPVQNLSSGFDEWSCAVAITITPQRRMITLPHKTFFPKFSKLTFNTVN